MQECIQMSWSNDHRINIQPKAKSSQIQWTDWTSPQITISQQIDVENAHIAMRLT